LLERASDRSAGSIGGVEQRAGVLDKNLAFLCDADTPRCPMQKSAPSCRSSWASRALATAADNPNSRPAADRFDKAADRTNSATSSKSNCAL
jgi:hypothetical protein